MNIKTYRTVNFLCLLIIAGIMGIYYPAFAQKPPFAELREIPNGAAPINTIEATFPFTVDDNACRVDLKACLLVNASVYDGGDAGLLSEDIEGDAAQVNVPILNLEALENCPNKVPTRRGGICLAVSEKNLLMVIYRFVTPPVLEGDKYSINIAIKTRAAGDVPAQVKGGYFASAKLEFTVSDPDIAVISDTEREQNKNLQKMYGPGGVLQDIVADHNIIKLTIKLPSKGDPLDSVAAQTKNGRTVMRRVRSLLAWLDARQGAPEGIAGVSVDVRDGTGPRPFPLAGFAYLHQDKDRSAPLPAPACPSGFEPDIPAELLPVTERELALYCDSRLVMHLVTVDDLPARPFFFKVSFNQNPPLELAAAARATPASAGIKALTTPDARTVGENKALGLRSFKSNFDLGFALTSSVQTANNVRLRDTNAAFDLMFAPVLDRYLTGPRKLQVMTTPFFIDAKASLDKSISKNTLSLNRTLIGSEISLLQLGKLTPGDKTHPADYDKFKYSFRFVNASDRDFKRVEAKFNFETLVRLAKLNRPLSQRTMSIPPSPLNPKAGPAAIPTGNFGYQVQPVFGLELGGVYREKRAPFSVERQESFVRRFYFGLDMQFDLTRLLQVNVKDTYYVRGEVENGRYRNYFLGELSTPLGKFGAKVAQSIFISFERGDQPPFVSPSVNTFKLGYRITSNFFDTLP